MSLFICHSDGFCEIVHQINLRVLDFRPIMTANSTEGFSNSDSVDMDDHEVSSVKISTQGLGPCLCFLLTFEHRETSMAYLSHGSYHDDVAGVPLPQVVVGLLSKISKDLADISGINPLMLIDAHLVITGDDQFNSENGIFTVQ